MLHMIQMQYSPEKRDAALEYFQQHGMTHYDGDLVIKGLWVCTVEHIAYVLVDASSTDEVASACQPLETFGEVEFRAVIESEQL